jgi:tRNA(Ile)-lysidine synthase
MKNRILIQNKNLLRRFPDRGSYLTAVSGGRDSVALLHWLIGAGYKRLIVCHLNHQLRGRSSDADARFVEKLSAQYHVEVVIGKVDVRGLAARRKLSIETAAREARYSFFAKVAKRKRCHLVFLAHHADDLVETFLINLFRGAGTVGLSGMREFSTRSSEGFDLTLARPFLTVWRNEVDEYIRQHRLKFREDASNKDLSPLRNRVRRRIIPYLEKAVGRNIRQSIWRAAMIAAEEENWIANQLFESDGADVSVTKLRETPVALQRRQIRNWLRAQNISDIGFDVVEEVRSLIERDSPIAKINLPRDRHVRRRAGKLFVE